MARKDFQYDHGRYHLYSMLRMPKWRAGRGFLWCCLYLCNINTSVHRIVGTIGEKTLTIAVIQTTQSHTILHACLVSPQNIHRCFSRLAVSKAGIWAVTVGVGVVVCMWVSRCEHQMKLLREACYSTLIDLDNETDWSKDFLVSALCNRELHTNSLMLPTHSVL